MRMTSTGTPTRPDRRKHAELEEETLQYFWN